MTLEFRNSKTVSCHWLFNPTVTPGKIRASKLQSAKKFPNPQSNPRSTFTPLEGPNLAKSLRPFLRSPQATRGEQI
jgi:hypothetical protein